MSELSMSAGAPPPGDNPALMALWRVLSALPPQEINGVLADLDFLQEFRGEERAKAIKAMRPSLTDEEVARRCGVSRRTLYRWEGYQRLKRYLAAIEAPRRRAVDMPDVAED